MKYRIGQRVRIVGRPSLLHPADCVGKESVILRHDVDDHGRSGYFLEGFTGRYGRFVTPFLLEEGYILFSDEHLEPILDGNVFAVFEVTQTREEVTCEPA